MAGRVLSAAVESLLVLVALLTAVHKCQCTCSVQVIPSSYEILSAAVYEDPACDPPSSSIRDTSTSPVTCFPSQQATGATPRLTDGVIGPDNLTSTTTDYAYTLAGNSSFKVWIQFEFVSRVSLASVTLHYYCTGQSPQFQLNGGSGVETPPVSPPCDSTAQRQCFTFSISTNTTTVALKVQRNDNTIYISEVKFCEESDTDCCMTAATPNSTQPGPMSTGHITYTLEPSDNSDNYSAVTVAGAVAGVVAGLVVCIAGAVLLIIACFIFKRKRNVNTKLSKGDDGLGQEKYTSRAAYQTTAEGKVSPKHPEVTYTTLHKPLYQTGKGPNEPTDSAVSGPHYSALDGSHYTAVDGGHYSAVNDPHYDAVKKESRANPCTGQSAHPTSPAAYDEIKTSMDTYSVPFSPDTDTVPANKTQKGRRAGDKAAMELEGGRSEKSDTTAGHVYAVVDKKRKEGEKDMTASKEREVELEKSAATAGAVYTVVDKKKEVPPPLPPPYQPGD